MINISFQYSNDALRIYELICAESSALSYNPQSIEVVGHKVLIKYVLRDCDYVLEQIVIPALTKFVLLYKESELLMTILQDRFFYCEVDEQVHILQMVQSIIEGEREDIPQQTFNDSKEQLVKEALTNFMKDGLTFTFESFLQFRLKEYMERLVYYIGIGIDEYKLEQEYQVFVNQLRMLIQESKTNVPSVHVFHHGEDEFAFYNDQFNELTEEQRQHFSEMFFQQHRTIYIDKQVVAPLLQMSPLKIHIYTSSSENSLIQTLQNIFEERIEIAHTNLFFEVQSFNLQQEVDF
ncbi:putative sporulation protein YtxC [Metabacillus iocasae]|uniref:Sporulation protein YtxC n=1 Tax=Priestia iocasae TaxID=2291674 RepID=A0ABS2QPW2_9BACI|nr:putative sporulation protein YtxC [Metabacillus iocasae]MBM7701253.1 putative sporulation protein YtxC [Metabacillus iocasae]